jgi:hypothetical protein
MWLSCGKLASPLLRIPNSVASRPKPRRQFLKRCSPEMLYAGSALSDQQVLKSTGSFESP